MSWKEDYNKKLEEQRKLISWCQEAKHITLIEDRYDSNGNNEQSDIYEKDGKLYRVDRSNDHIYPPVEVYPVSRMELVTEYYEKKQNA
jgi:hypothetical protein